MSTAVTEGIRVEVQGTYQPERSEPGQRRWVFAYTVTIRNGGSVPAQLISRHWIITDSNGKVQEVKGLGVVGEQPLLAPGQVFQYTSSCVLKTSHGSMRGSYQLVRDDGRGFDAEIAQFPLVVPGLVN